MPIDYTQPLETLARGSRHAGFTVTDQIPLREISGYAYVMRHDATGARLLWLACADDDRSFSIAFKTPPADSTGTFHILEHSVLCGSDRFPVKEPFVNLLKTSMQTFLNALTFSDKTMYPVASTNVADLENLMDVYLDAVLHPAIYRRRRIFEQEGWHLELVGEDGRPAAPADADARLALNGVVLNEMKGALSDPDAVVENGLDAALFPESPYRFESGGDPREIPTLTYEAFLDNHARHYDLANSYTVLYGDLDIDRELAFIGERFDGACRRGAGAPNPLPLQPPVVAAPRTVEMATAPENAQVALAYVVGTAADRERVLAADVLVDALAGSNEAPLKRAVLDAGLGDDLEAVLVTGELQPRVVLALKGARPHVAEKFRELVEATCARLAREGIGRERLEASLAQAEFNLREGDTGDCPDGVVHSIRVMASWLYDDARPVDYLRYEDAIAHLKEGVAEGAFERLLDEVVCRSAHSAQVELVPCEGGADDEEAAELARRRESLSDAELARIAEEVSALREEQEAPDSPEALATLPQLSLADIGPARERPACPIVEAPAPCIAHELDTRGIDYVYHYFDLDGIGFEELPYAAVLADVLGKLDTAEHTAAEFDTLSERRLGDLAYFVEAYDDHADPTRFSAHFVVAASALSENVGWLAKLPAETWSETDYAGSLDRIRDILQQRRVAMEQTFTNAGHAVALSRLDSYFSPSAAFVEKVGGVDYYLFLKRLLANFDELGGYLADRLLDVARRVFSRGNLTVSFVGPAADRARFWEAAGSLGLSDAPRGHYLEVPAPKPANEAFVTPSNVAFVALGAPRRASDAGGWGTWQVAARALSFDYLWNEVRVKGGAYGVGFRRTQAGLREFWSYRDPSVDATLERYARAADWLAAWQPSEAELEGYVISVVAAIDAPLKPRQLARRQDADLFCHRPDGWRIEMRDQVLHATPDAVRALAPSLADVSESGAVCVFGSREKIEASKADLCVRDLMEAVPSAGPFGDDAHEDGCRCGHGDGCCDGDCCHDHDGGER